MMVFDVDMLGTWAHFGGSGKFVSTKIILKKSALDGGQVHDGSINMSLKFR